MDIELPAAGEDVTPDTFSYTLRRDKLRLRSMRREGRYLLRSNLREEDRRSTLWKYLVFGSPRSDSLACSADLLTA